MIGDGARLLFFPVTIHTDSPAGDLSRLRIDRDAAPRRRWLPWLVLVVLLAAGAAVYPTARAYLNERRAPEVDVARATQVITTPGGSTDLPVLVATGYVVARHSSDVGVKTGGRLAHAQVRGRDPRPEGRGHRGDRARGHRRAARGVAPHGRRGRGAARAGGRVARRRPAQPRSPARARQGRHHDGPGADRRAGGGRGVDRARHVGGSRDCQRARARAGSPKKRSRTRTSARPSTASSSRSARRSGRRCRRSASRGRPRAKAARSRRSPISTSSRCRPRSAKTASPSWCREMPAEVKLQAYQDQVYKGRLRQIFPSADRAKAIVEVRVSILNPDGHVKPEMSASVTFQEKRANAIRSTSDADQVASRSAIWREPGADRVGAEAGGRRAERTVLRLGGDRGQRDAAPRDARRRASRPDRSPQRRGARARR